MTAARFGGSSTAAPRSDDRGPPSPVTRTRVHDGVEAPVLGEQSSFLLLIPPLPTLPPPAAPHRPLLKLLWWFSTVDSSLSPPLNYRLLAGCSTSKRGTNDQLVVSDRGSRTFLSLCLSIYIYIFPLNFLCFSGGRTDVAAPLSFSGVRRTTREDHDFSK